MTHRPGTIQAEDTISGDTQLPRSRISTDCSPLQARTHPTSCCCPATAVSVFYYDFLRLSFSRPRGISGGPSVSLLPFSLFPEAKHTHARVHSHSTPGHHRVLEDSEEPDPEGNMTHPSAPQGPEMRGSRGERRWCPPTRPLSRSTAW